MALIEPKSRTSTLEPDSGRSRSRSRSKSRKGAGSAQRIRGQLPAHVRSALPKWVTADQIRALIAELEYNPGVDVEEKLVEFALEQEGVLK